MKLLACLAASLLIAFFTTCAIAIEPGTIVIDGSKPGAKIGPLFYGLMTEEINHAYDGGLYAELIQNRIFQDAKEPVCWSVIGNGKIAIDEKNPVNSAALKRSLRLHAAGDRTGIANTGFYGIPIRPNTKYRATFYARATDGATGPLMLSIESNDGATTFASANIAGITGEWKKYSAELTTADVKASSDNRFVISTSGKGSIWFSLVSLFPPTFHDRPNGNRIDLMQKLEALHPSFLRFPGGNFLEGDTVPTRFNWKETIGPLENRPGHMGCWSYHVSDGLGLLEFLNWCEDLKMEPLLAVYAGYSLQQKHVSPGADLEPFVQEALDEIEYCTGDTNTTWGKQRAIDGHPAPFAIHYIEIGNEDWFDNSHTYDARFAQIFDAIKKKYPNLKCIATAPVTLRRPDLYDDHDYPSARQMLRNARRYDKPDPQRPKVFFGEWATQDGKPTPTMKAALSDAAWLTALQRDSDTVLLNCYAPLLVNVNKGAWQWPTNLIGYDAGSSFGSPSYYAQCMFANAWGDTNLSVKLELSKTDSTASRNAHGGIGVGTWRTESEYKDISVVTDGKNIYSSDFSTGMKGWHPMGGKWEITEGALVQNDLGEADLMTVGQPQWQDYTLQLKARKISGSEGFLILFHAHDKNNCKWLNLGGWNNSQSGLEDRTDGSTVMIGQPVDFKVAAGKWYDVRIELKGTDIKCFVDDKLIIQATDTAAQPTESVFVAASREDATGSVILKVVNTADVPQPLKIELQNLPALAKDATIEILQGNPAVQNTLTAPQEIAPTTELIEILNKSFQHEFPANSISVIRILKAN